MAGFDNGSPLSVSAYPVAWRIEVVNDEIHRDFEYVRSGRYTTAPFPEQPADPTY